MNNYEKARLFVDIYEKHLEDLFIPTGIEEIDLVRKHLIRDIRLVNAIISGYSQVENADSHLNSELSELIKEHKAWREMFDKYVSEEIDFLSNKYKKNKNAFLKAANFYLMDVYINFGLDEEAALVITSTITGIPKEKLKEAKDKKINPNELEKYVELMGVPEEESYDFNTSTIHLEMKSLLEQANYESLDIEGKINVIEESLKIYLTRLLHRVSHDNDLFRDFEKDLEDLMELMAIFSNNPDNVWDITNYLLEIMGTLGKSFNIVLCDDTNLKDGLFIDTDKMLISIHKNTEPIAVFKIIYEKLFNKQFLENGNSLRK